MTVTKTSSDLECCSIVPGVKTHGCGKSYRVKII